MENVKRTVWDLNDDNDMHCYRGDHEIYRHVLQARRAAHEKHGLNSIEAIQYEDPRWLAILVEEIGELAHSLTYDSESTSFDILDELFDIMAVASAWTERLIRDVGLTR